MFGPNAMIRALRCLRHTAWFLVIANGVASEVLFVVNDAGTQTPIPCRIHLLDSGNKPVSPKDLPFWRDHFVCPGEARLELSLGRYRYEIERGPEWNAATGELAVAQTPLAVTNRLRRLARLSDEGWWSGDLHVHRPPEQIELLMRAEDLHIAPIITWWNRSSYWTNRPVPAHSLVNFDTNRFYHLMGGEDERDGGALLYFDLPEPFDITAGERSYPHSLVYARAIKKKTPRVWIDLEKPFWWDFPAWVAAGVGDSVGIANNHQHRSGMMDSEAWGKPRPNRDDPLGNGWWTLSIYYHLLNCGFRLPPSAGSASGVLPNPVGYNRAYVHVDGELSWDKWWAALRSGKCFVSNGPLLRCRANSHLPGHVFKITKGESMDVELDVQLTSRDPIAALEIITNGAVSAKITGEQLSSPIKHRLRLSESGWFLVRAFANVPHTFRYASTGPFHVESGDAKRISKESAKFFYEWTRERIGRVKLDDPERREEVLRFYRDAEAFWKQRVADATVP
jgi:hypothetical protein